MIRDAKGGPWGAVLAWYVRRKVRAAFRGLWVRGSLPEAGGLLCYANHSNFWDGFVIHQLSRAAGWDGYAVMEERNLARYPFHRRLGAFSTRPGEARAAVETIRYAKQVLARPGAAVFIFPEGRINVGGALGPLARGVEVMARAAQARCLPVAIRYAFHEHERPDVLLEVGVPHEPVSLDEFRARLEDVHHRLRDAPSTDGFRLLLEGAAGIRERWDAFRGAGSTRHAPPTGAA